jgi:hypothetical protein
MKRCTDCMSIANRPQADLQVVCETDVDGKSCYAESALQG